VNPPANILYFRGPYPLVDFSAGGRGVDPERNRRGWKFGGHNLLNQNAIVGHR
jgi:hypothetical protein